MLIARRVVVIFVLFVLPVSGAAQLRISTDKDTVNFTKVKIGYSRDGNLRVSNTSLTTVFVNDMLIVSHNATSGEFQIVVPQPQTFHIDSGDGRSIIITFRPQAVGVRTATLEILTDDGIKEIGLVGEGSTIQPDILMRPQFIEFGMLSPGEFKDTTLLVIGGDKDSATLDWLYVANDNAAVHFEVSPIDAQVKFPLVVHNGDTVKLNVRFLAFNASGPRSGRTVMQGEVSGEVLCEFHGEVGIPEMIFTPQILDLGVVVQGSTVDTFISIASTGESPVKLQKVDKPNLPYSISGLPSFPYLIAAGDTLKIPVHFAASVPGAHEEGLSALSKNGSAAPINRSALIKAFVIPQVLSKVSPQPFVVSCALDSIYSKILSISDTGSFPISISGISCSDTEFSFSYPAAFPDTIKAGDKRDITITFTASSASPITGKTCVVNVMTNGRVIISDTITLVTHAENIELAAVPIVSTGSALYSNSVGIVSVSDLARYKMTALEMELSIDPPDVAEIDTQNVVIENTVFPNAVVKITYDNSSKKYIATISSSTDLPASPVIPFLRIPLHYYVAKDSSATLRVVTRSPEKDGCLVFSNDSIMVSSAQGCGDPALRNFLNNSPLMAGLRISPNPSQGKHITVSFTNAENILLSSELLDMSGRLIQHSDPIFFTKGKNNFQIGISGISSGEYGLHLAARTFDGREHDLFITFIIDR